MPTSSRAPRPWEALSKGQFSCGGEVLCAQVSLRRGETSLPFGPLGKVLPGLGSLEQCSGSSRRPALGEVLAPG